MTAKVLPIARDYVPLEEGDSRRRRTAKGYINANGGREHIVIAVFAFGGPLPVGYEVHHVNERKDDNHPENLIICETRRLHRLLHAVPELLEQCEWLGEPDASVRLFRAFEPPGANFCIRCKRCKPLADFQRSRKYVSGVRGECALCRRGDDKRKRREFRAAHPIKPRVYAGLSGHRNPSAKLSSKEVLEIRRLYGKGETQVVLASKFGVTQSTISLIVMRKHWSHL